MLCYGGMLVLWYAMVCYGGMLVWWYAMVCYGGMLVYAGRGSYSCRQGDATLPPLPHHGGMVPPGWHIVSQPGGGTMMARRWHGAQYARRRHGASMPGGGMVPVCQEVAWCPVCQEVAWCQYDNTGVRRHLEPPGQCWGVHCAPCTVHSAHPTSLGEAPHCTVHCHLTTAPHRTHLLIKWSFNWVDCCPFWPMLVSGDQINNGFLF